MDLIKYPNPLLKQKSLDINLEKENLEKLKSDLTYHMYLHDGCGLSAVQLGILKNAFVIHDYELDRERVFFNPKIVGFDEHWKIDFEGCLSFSKKEKYKIRRLTSIFVSYWDLDGFHQFEQFKDLNARIIQHEYDHLQGVTFDTKVKKIRKL